MSFNWGCRMMEGKTVGGEVAASFLPERVVNIEFCTRSDPSDTSAAAPTTPTLVCLLTFFFLLWWGMGGPWVILSAAEGCSLSSLRSPLE